MDEQAKHDFNVGEKLLCIRLVLMFGVSGHERYSLEELLQLNKGNALFNKAADHPDVWRALARGDGFVTEGVKDHDIKNRYIYTAGYYIPKMELDRKKEGISSQRCTCKTTCCCTAITSSFGAFMGVIAEAVVCCYPASWSTLAAHLTIWGFGIGLAVTPLVCFGVAKVCHTQEDCRLNYCSPNAAKMKKTQKIFQGRFFEPLRRISDPEETPEVVTMGEDATNTFLQRTVNNDNNNDGVVAQPAQVNIDERTPLLSPKHL